MSELRQTPFRLSNEMKERLELYAKVSGRSMNLFAINAIEAEMARLDRDKEFRQKLQAEITRRQKALRKLKGAK